MIRRTRRWVLSYVAVPDFELLFLGKRFTRVRCLSKVYLLTLRYVMLIDPVSRGFRVFEENTGGL